MSRRKTVSVDLRMTRPEAVPALRLVAELPGVGRYPLTITQCEGDHAHYWTVVLPAYRAIVAFAPSMVAGGAGELRIVAGVLSDPDRQVLEAVLAHVSPVLVRAFERAL